MKNIQINLTRDFLIGISKASLENNRYKTNIWKRTPSEWNERMYASCEGAKPSAKFCGVPCCQNTVLNGADGCSFGGWSSKRPGPEARPCRVAFNGGPPPSGEGIRKVYGSETQHLPNMKSGTRITRSSRGEARRGSWKPETWNRGCDEGREKIERERGTQKGGETHRSRGQEILDLRDAYSQYGVHDFRSIPVPRRRVLCINSANERQVNRRMQSLECICEWDHAEINLREE